MPTLLNYKLEGMGSTVVLIHGLFGSLSNLATLARELRQQHQILSLDLRNHGLSFHHSDHNYQTMAEDVIALLDHLNIDHASLIGHSMGGKVAMKMADLIPKRITKLLVLDMAPVTYASNGHDDIFAGLKAVDLMKPNSRSEALNILSQYIKQDNVCQFLTKSLYFVEAENVTETENVIETENAIETKRTLHWRFNLEAISKHYSDILSWKPIQPCQVPTLFIKGSLSDYLTAAYQAAIEQQFLDVKREVINNAGHWLHAEKPAEVLLAIHRFINAS